MLKIGIDFDNTIVQYDQIFHKVALEKGLISPDVLQKKDEVRNYLRKIDKEDEWTLLQGYVYGARMTEASPYPGVLDFISNSIKQGNSVFIISHKTRHPYMGEKYDLHASARAWLNKFGFFDSSIIGMPEENAFFELTKDEKINRIKQQGCDIFIDDLPEILQDPAFPDKTKRILFSAREIELPQGILQIRNWDDLSPEVISGS